MPREGTSAFSFELGAISALSSGTRAAMDPCLLLYLLACVDCQVEPTSFHLSQSCFTIQNVCFSLLLLDNQRLFPKLSE